MRCVTVMASMTPLMLLSLSALLRLLSALLLLLALSALLLASWPLLQRAVESTSRALPCEQPTVRSRQRRAQLAPLPDERVHSQRLRRERQLSAQRQHRVLASAQTHERRHQQHRSAAATRDVRCLMAIDEQRATAARASD